MLDGQTSLDEIKDRFEEEFPPQKITLEELQQFLGMLHRSGLVVADVGGQAANSTNAATNENANSSSPPPATSSASVSRVLTPSGS